MKTVRLLFSDDMARPVVEGRKTVTRRPMKVQPLDLRGPPHPGESDAPYMWCDGLDGVRWKPLHGPCAPGDLLIGRECWTPSEDGGAPFYRASEGAGWRPLTGWRPSIHMPDSAARIRRRVVGVTVERVQDVTEEDAVREGFGTGDGLDEIFRNCAPPGSRMARPRDSFEATWDSIYAAKGLGWEANPYVWRIEFSAENEA